MSSLLFTKAYAVTTEFGEVANLDAFINIILDKVFYVGYLLAGLVIIFAGFKMITSSGSPESMTSAKSILVGAVLGLIMLYLIAVFYNLLTGK